MEEQPYKVSPNWDRFLARRSGNAEPPKTTIDQLLQKIEVIPDQEPEPEPELSLEERRVRLKKAFNHYAQLMTREGYEYNGHNRPILNTLTEHFLGQESGLDPAKGICLIGEPGRGKSQIMEIWAKTLTSLARVDGRYPEELHPVSFQRVVQLCRELQQQDQEKNKDLEKLYTRKVIHPDYFERLKFGVVLDDIGKEVIEKAYNYNVNPMIAIYNARYDLFEKQGVITHATTNCPPRDLEQLGFSEAMIDRFFGMFNFLHLFGESFRTK